MSLLKFLLPFLFAVSIFASVDIDSNGYILYCPCMGNESTIFALLEGCTLICNNFVFQEGLVIKLTISQDHLHLPRHSIGHLLFPHGWNIDLGSQNQFRFLSYIILNWNPFQSSIGLSQWRSSWRILLQKFGH